MAGLGSQRRGQRVMQKAGDEKVWLKSNLGQTACFCCPARPISSDFAALPEFRNYFGKDNVINCQSHRNKTKVVFLQ